jgi:hypothetical protein
MDSVTNKFPAQQLPYSQKGEKWRKACVDYACSHSFMLQGANRKSYANKKINYDLLNGIIDMKDIEVVLNPTGLQNDLVSSRI